MLYIKISFSSNLNGNPLGGGEEEGGGTAGPGGGEEDHAGRQAEGGQGGQARAHLVPRVTGWNFVFLPD